MKEVILDETLEIQERNFPEFSPRKHFNINGDFEAISNVDSEITHRNYLDYLTICWRRHYGVIISPTILWNMVLNISTQFIISNEPIGSYTIEVFLRKGI